ncbi:formylglycine-generating enzyme family protein [uncultured Thiocystis sp.]|jgi:formylglycine-generating enzyme required for sulfatase activity|uniref:formylglycine-generating enzyme family protein n=1 Tax=uncultured Thiocystis sp. TaxID=1202134 RepID=UPI0025DE6F74|nr:formylglycine-generating enzyme family protein [uncultured Thiocystis sp.]
MRHTLLALSLLATALPALAEDADTYTNDLGMEFALIPAGSFMMGCNASFESCGNNELPQHRVRIDTPFYLGVTEVTQEQWVSVMGNNPSNFKRRRTNPVEQVSWHDAQAFIRALNTKEGCSGCYRLPSEAEWEYAARAGTTTAYWFGDSADDLGQYAWFDDNSNEKTHPVGQTPANPWGLYDMHGNIFEWVQDCYHESYSGAPTDGSAWATGCDKDSSGNAYYGLRGGSWILNAIKCRAATRYINSPDVRNNYLGFRVVRVVSPGLR